MRLAAVVFALFAAPVAAQDLTFDPAPLVTCLEGGGQALCIGRAADVCQEQDGGYTTVGMGYCYDQERQFWDDRLNTVYGWLMARELEYDAELDEVGSAAPRTAEILRQMQRAWIPYRDAVCEYERAQWGGGTGQGTATAACLMEETARQVLRIEVRLKQLDGQ